MAIIPIDPLNTAYFTNLDNFTEYNYTESVCQHHFRFQKENESRTLNVYLNSKTGFHTAHLVVDDWIITSLNYHKLGNIMLYDQCIYFEHERKGGAEKIIEIDTENLKINVTILNHLSLVEKGWLDASPQTLKPHEFIVLKEGINCTSEAIRGTDIFYKCLFCETMISSAPKDSVSCKCRSIHIDIGMFKFYVKNYAKIQVIQLLKKARKIKEKAI